MPINVDDIVPLPTRILDWFAGAFSKTITIHSAPSVFFGAIGGLIGYFKEWNVSFLFLIGLLLPVWPVYAYHTNRRVIRSLLADLKEYHAAGLISEDVRDQCIEIIANS